MIATDSSFTGFDAAFGIEGRRMVDYVVREKLRAAGYTVFDDRNQGAAPANAKRFSMNVNVTDRSRWGERARYEIETSGTYLTSLGETVDAMGRAYGTTEGQPDLFSAAWAHLRARSFYTCGGGVTAPDTRGGAGDDDRDDRDDGRRDDQPAGAGAGTGAGSRGPR